MKRILPLILIAFVAGVPVLEATETARAEGREWCPRNAKGEDRFDANSLDGKRIKRAREIADRYDCTVRVIKRDGVARPITDDLRPNRINVVVRDDRVKRVDGVY